MLAPRLPRRLSSFEPDPYVWVRAACEAELDDHIAAENRYTEALTAHLEPLRHQILAEISARTLQTDMSVPDYDIDTQGRAWWYYSRTTEGNSYPSYWRAPAPNPDQLPDLSGPVPGEMLLLDAEAAASGHDFFALGDLAPSPNGNLLLWSFDTTGDERYTIRLRELTSGADLPDQILAVAEASWIDDQHLAYTVWDETWRPYQMRRHRLGDAVEQDSVVVEETDPRFWLHIDRSADEAWLVVSSASRTTSEVRLLSVNQPTDTPWLVTPRQPGLEYDIEPAGDRLLVVHNGTHADFEIAEAPLRPGSRQDWRPVLPPVPGTRVLMAEACASHVVVTRRRDGVLRLMLCPRGPDGAVLAGTEVTSGPLTTLTSIGQRYHSDRFRYQRESFINPAQVVEQGWSEQVPRILKTRPVRPDLSGKPFDPDCYREQRLWAPAPDGTQIPVSVIYAAATEFPAPCLLSGYGAYEASIDPAFSIPRLSLLDRGVVIAYAHVRGGGELGRSWYEAGRLNAKPTTFGDFVACGRFLLDSGIAAAGRLAAQGFSAGGLTVAAALNLDPDLFAAVHCGVGFVDPLRSMLDPDLPLTITERDEWGDPLADPEAYHVIAGYSPYDNIRHRRYPPVLATASRHDQRVSYTEPLRWVAALRDAHPDNEALLQIEVSGGHAGASGRYAAWRDEAFEMAWLLSHLGCV